MVTVIQKRFATQMILLLLLLVAAHHSYAQGKAKSEEYLQRLTKAKNYKDSVRIYCLVADRKRYEEQHNEAKYYAGIAVLLSKKHNNFPLLGTAYFHVAQSFFEHENFDSARIYAQKSISAYDAANVKPVYYPYVVNMIGGYYLNKGDVTTALEYAHRQMDVAIEIKDTVSISNSYTLLAAVYGMLENPDDVLLYTKKALEINRLSGQVFNRAQVLSNLAAVYIEMKEADSAMVLLREMLHVATHERKALRSEGMAYMYMGKCHSLKNNFDSAIHYLKKAGQILVPLNDVLCIGEMLQYSGEAYRQIGQYDSAIKHVDKSFAFMSQGGGAGFAVELLRVRAEILAAAGNYKDAYTSYLQYRNISDSMFNADMQHKIAQLREQYESEKKDGLIARQQALNSMLQGQAKLQEQRLQNEILLKQALESENELAQQQIVTDSVIKSTLDKENSLKQTQLAQATRLNTVLAEDNKLREAALRKEKTINSLLISGFIIVLLFSGLAFAQYRKQKAANRIIVEQSDKLTLLMKELHHRVKNNLQIISSLLSLQSFRIKDAAASRAVREGQQRIEAMSLIHQRLYTRDNITEINIKEFISDLVDSLQSAYGYLEDDITISLDIANELMNVDQAIPLSLIINELVTNVFKYACEDNSHPELSIKLMRANGSIHLSVTDNGKGVNIEDWKEKEGSFGKELIRTFVKQLNGYLDLTVKNGTQFKLTIPAAA